MNCRRQHRATARSIFGLAAMLVSTGLWAGSLIVKPMASTSSAIYQVMVNTLLGGGITVVPGSVQYTGAPSAVALFTSTGTGLATTIGLASGVVLTTGDARFVSGSSAFAGDLPNKAIRFTSGIGNSLTRNTAPGNTLFSALTTAPTYNATILSFQFIPAGSSITMNYVFGSEDYNDGVNGQLPVDVMGIFVNGVDYAVVPGTTTPVSAASINCGGPISGAANGVNPSNCRLYRDNPPFVGTIDTELNGLTVPLQVTAPVVPGQINTMRIGIANAFDPSYDSAVFIQAGSLHSAP